MTRDELYNNICRKGTFLCVGLDSDIDKIPSFLKREKDPVFEFNRAIIDATAEYVIAYKPNLAFYESRGTEGWRSLEKTVAYLRDKHPDIFLIADAKRGDIGNTSGMYARAFLKNLDFDSITVAPYMGEDSVKPFLEHEGKWVILLALTSNKGADDFQYHPSAENSLFRLVLEKSRSWGNENNMMYVVGATRAEMLSDIRKIVPDHFLLIPGVGAQGGSLQEVVRYGMNDKCSLIVNSSRGIIFADQGKNFAETAGQKARELRDEMQNHLTEGGLI